PDNFVATLGRLFWSETVAARVFGHYAWHAKVQKIIFATGLGAAAAHFESAIRVAADNRARARAVDVKVAGFQAGFHSLDVIGAAREKAARQRVVGSIRDFERLVEIPHFQDA